MEAVNHMQTSFVIDMTDMNSSIVGLAIETSNWKKYAKRNGIKFNHFFMKFQPFFLWIRSNSS